MRLTWKYRRKFWVSTPTWWDMKAAPQAPESIKWHHLRANPQTWHDANDADHKQKQSLASQSHLRFHWFLLPVTDTNNATQRKGSRRKAAKPRNTSNYEYTSSAPIPSLSPNHHNLIPEEADQTRRLCFNDALSSEHRWSSLSLSTTNSPFPPDVAQLSHICSASPTQAVFPIQFSRKIRVKSWGQFTKPSSEVAHRRHISLHQ